MKILISNDDGFEALGLKCLRNILKAGGHDVFVVVPDKNQSATSHSLTLTVPLRIRKVVKNEWMTTGTPTDCVLMATHGLIKQKMDLVISGINHGPNMGEDVLYSGTVAAAMEGVMMGIPSIAVSLASFSNLDFKIAEEVVPKLLEIAMDIRYERMLLNVNIPNIPVSKLKGYKFTRLGSRVYTDTLITKVDPRGKKYYWIGGEHPTFKVKNGTDFQAIERNYVSITPISVDITDYKCLSALLKKRF
ncbi:MAG: 5'/3'-nucleotidase SurE [bacterium]